jgi:hypothetical protein
MYQKHLLLIASLLGHFVTFAQPTLPSIEEVASKFYNTYQTDGGQEYSMEKRADRWMVAVKEWKAPQLVLTGRYLYFAADSGGYLHLPLPAKTDTPWVNFRQHIDDYDLANYHIQAYYGYDGWYKDVIASLS